MPVIPKKGGPWSLFCTDCKVWTPNTANYEMKKEGFYASSHVCGIVQRDEIRDEDYRKDGGLDDIRAMSDKKLAYYLNNVETDGRVYGPQGEAYWLDWLRQEAHDDP